MNYEAHRPVAAILNTSHLVVIGGNDGTKNLNTAITADLSNLMRTTSATNDAEGKFSGVTNYVLMAVLMSTICCNF